MIAKENNMKKRFGIVLSMLVIMTLACTLSGVPATQAPGVTSQGNPQGNPTEPPPLQPGGTPPSSPVSINEGLSSLNSYQMTITFKSVGPDPSQSSTTIVETQRSQDQDATYTKINQSSIPTDGGDPSTSETYMYQIGFDSCSGSEEDWSWSTMAPNEKEMLDITKNMLGFTPLIDNPSFVAEETVNGISTNHFTFKVSGLGVTSGAEVITNQGDYWLAIDGQYIVKYYLVMETSVDPQSNILHEEISIELNQANQPVNIAFPQGCLDASLVTPEP
jgi:hypothetical protein